MVFSNAIKVSGSSTADSAIEKPRDVVYKHFALLCFVFHGAAPGPYAAPRLEGSSALGVELFKCILI